MQGANRRGSVSSVSSGIFQIPKANLDSAQLYVFMDKDQCKVSDILLVIFFDLIAFFCTREIGN